MQGHFDCPISIYKDTKPLICLLFSKMNDKERKYVIVNTINSIFSCKYKMSISLLIRLPEMTDNANNVVVLIFQCAHNEQGNKVAISFRIFYIYRRKIVKSYKKWLISLWYVKNVFSHRLHNAKPNRDDLDSFHAYNSGNFWLLLLTTIIKQLKKTSRWILFYW